MSGVTTCFIAVPLAGMVEALKDALVRDQVRQPQRLSRQLHRGVAEHKALQHLDHRLSLARSGDQQALKKLVALSGRQPSQRHQSSTGGRFPHKLAVLLDSRLTSRPSRTRRRGYASAGRFPSPLTASSLRTASSRRPVLRSDHLNGEKSKVPKPMSTGGTVQMT